MIKIVKGNLMDSEADALINTVNTVGVMGKGIALQFKEAFPNNYKAYVKACKNNELEPGKLLAVWDQNIETGKKLIINFPTKVHWRNPSQYTYIEKGLVSLKVLLQKEKIKTIAMPPLGSGNGGLNWNNVKFLIEKELADIETIVFLYEPIEEIKTLLQKKNNVNDVKLTAARASLLYALFAFESKGLNSSLFVANKIAYFLQRKGQKLNLEFKPHFYGPYSIGVEKVLYHLNGVYLNGLEQGQHKPFESFQLNYEKWEEVDNYVNNHLPFEEKQRLKNLILFLSVYSSELSLEILSSVDYILQDNPNYSVDQVMDSIIKWNSRKRELFKREYVQSSYEYLKQSNN